jgi:hypothetical protein
MKLICLSAVCLLSLSGLSQSDSSFFDLKKHLQSKNQKVISLMPLQRNVPGKKVPIQFLKDIVNSSRYGYVYTLPQDNMPCIVPDMRLYQNMPNIARKEDLTIDTQIHIVPVKPKK